jgi:hypothetical protein
MKLLKQKQHSLRTLVAALAMTFISTTHVQASVNSDFQTWIPININVKLGEQLRGFLEFQPRIGDDTSHLTTMIIRPALGWAVTPTVTLWAGYLMSADEVLDSKSGLYTDRYLIENRAWQGLTWKDMTEDKQFTWEMRNRLEERFLAANADPSIRWRTRFRFEQLIPAFPALSVIASEELFVNLNDNENNRQLQAGLQQNRAYIGLGYRFAPQFQIETGYLEQHVWRRAGKADQNNSIWMTNFNFNF